MASPVCDFCGQPNTIMKRSGMGGFPPYICGPCILDYAQEIVIRAEEYEKNKPQPKVAPKLAEFKN